jgi:hypothetical protein
MFAPGKWVAPPVQDRARRLKPLRIALLLQAMALLVSIALTVPDYLEARFHPRVCVSWCLDLQGLAFYLSVIFFGPVIVILLLLVWRWRGSRRWPLAVVATIDALAIYWAAASMIPFVHPQLDSIPSVAFAPPLLLLPALATLALGANLVRMVPWKPTIAASAVGCLLLAAFLWTHVIQPVHQRIPGEISLPFSRVVAYEGRDLGCQDYLAGWTHQHVCTRATLLIYRGSGDPSSDQATINQVLLAQKRLQPGEDHVVQLPVDMVVNRTDSPEVDPSNSGLCLLITDRFTAAPSTLSYPHCGSPDDYADIRSHWPAEDAYAIGIIYKYSPPDYRSR